MKRFFLLAIGLLISSCLFADNVTNMPHKITQPNGKVIPCFISGDEFYHRLHDENGYTIIQNELDGYFYYGVRSGDKVVPSKYLVGTINPKKAGLEPDAKISESLYKERRAKIESPLKSTNGTPTKGLVNGLCIYITFADDTLMMYNRKHYTDMWSAEGSSSVHDYFKEISYNTLDLQISHFPTSPDSINITYRDFHPRRYFKPKTASNPEGYDGDSGEREGGLMKRAVESVLGQIPGNLDVDMNDDGVVDNISFVIQGEAPNADWSNLLWPHKTSLYAYDVRIQGARIQSYFLTLENFGTGTMCHELGHVFGAPDLYHYSSSGKTGPDAVGSWCLMCGSQDPPQSICGFLKFKYNHWIDNLPEISTSGVYSLKPLSNATGNLYKIKSPYSKSEYFVLEYRRKTGRYESSAPGTGLVVYRINPNAGNGNAGGPPDEVYVYRPGGSLTAVGSLGSAAMSSPTRKAINDKTDPNSFLYNSGQGGPGGLDISNVSTAGDSITFQVYINNLFPPTNLAYSEGTGVVDLQWKASAAQDLKGYNVYRNGIKYGSTTQTTFRDIEVYENVSYNYAITSVYEGQFTGESLQSNVVTYTPKGIMTLPYKEDFETPGHGWKLKFTVEGFQWGEGPTLLMDGDNKSKFIGASSVAAGINTKCTDYAITPRINMFGKTKVYAHFDYTLKRWQQLDHLKIFFRRNKNEIWIQIIDMPTSGISSGYKWRKYNLEIPGDSYTAEAQLGFQYDDGNDLGYGAGIDNIVIDEVATSNVEETDNVLKVNMFPNPAGDETTLDISGNQGGDVSLKLVTVDGKVVWSDIRHNYTSGQQQISLKGLASGMYYMVVETENEVTVKSLVKQN